MRDFLRIVPCAVALVFASNAHVGGESDQINPLDRLREIALTESVDVAAQSYRTWLTGNEGSQFAHLARVELARLVGALSESRIILEAALESADNDADRHLLLRELALAAEASGELALAQRYYRDASFAVADRKDFSSLLSSALILFELGNVDKAEAEARIIRQTVKDQELRKRSIVLLSRIYYATDRDDAAIEILLTVSGAPMERLGADGLYWLVRLADHLELDATSQVAASQLASRFPNSMENALLAGEADRLPTPTALLESTRLDVPTDVPVAEVDEGSSGAAGTTPESTEGEEDSSSEVERISESEDESVGSHASGQARIQTGSYTVKENAEFAAADLREAGFEAIVEQRTVSDTLYYRVVVTTADDDESATVLLQLREEGFEGFPIYD